MERNILREALKGAASFLLVAFLSLNPCAFAEEKPFEKTAAGKAAQELIKQFTNLVKDLDEMSGMSDQQKVQYILTKGRERIQKQSVKLVKDTIKAKLLEYAKARLKSDLFKAEIPSMLHQVVVEGKTVSGIWSQVDATMKSKLDTQMNAVKGALDAVEIGWDVLDAWSKKGTEAGLRKLGEKIGDKIVAYLVPGWGWYKLAQDLVKAIGEYVVNYAFDTALEAKMKVVLGANDPQTNPAGFVDWIQKVDIASYVQREWDEQLAYGGWYLKGAGNEGENMKMAIIAELNKLKGEVQQKKQVESELRQKLSELDDQAAKASDAVKDTADKAMSQFEPAFKVIQNYENAIGGFAKQDAQENVTEEEQEQAQQKAWYTKVRMAAQYTPMDQGSVLSALEAALDGIKESGTDGYDAEKISDLYKHYQEVRTKAIQKSSEDIANKIEASSKVLEQLSAQYLPQLRSIGDQMNAARDEAHRNALAAQYNAISNAWSNAATPHFNVVNAWILHSEQAKDIEVLAAKEQVAYAGAAERAAKKRQEIVTKLGEAAEKLNSAVEGYAQSRNELEAAVGALNYAGAWRSPDFLESMVNALSGEYEWVGDVVKAREGLLRQKDAITADVAAAGPLHAKENENFEKFYATDMEDLKVYRSVIPKALILQEGPTNDAVEAFCFMNRFYAPWGSELLSEVWYESGGVVIYRVWGYMPAADYRTFLAKNPYEADKALRALQPKITEAENLSYPDELAKIFLSVMTRVTETRIMMMLPDRTVDDEKRKADEATPYQYNDSAHMFVVPENSEGAKYLAELKAAWEANKELVDRLDKLRKKIGRAVKYKFDFYDHTYRLLDAWDSVPERIRIYEAALERGKKSYEDRTALSEKYLTEARQEFDRIVKETIAAYRPDRLKPVLANAKNGAQLTGVWLTHGGTDHLKAVNAGWGKLKEDVEKAINEAVKQSEEDKKKFDDQMRRDEEERRRREEDEAERKKKEEETRKAEMKDYRLLDTRLNTRSLQNASGDVIATPADLRSGAFEVTARLDTIDGVRTLLVSEGNGGSWNEIPVNSDILYRFVPAPERLYQPVLKIKNAAGGEASIPFFPNINGILYRSINYEKLLMETVTKIAEAYETQDLARFERLVSRDFLGNRVFLSEGVRFDFDMFMSIRLALYINRIEMRGNTFVAETKWDKTQTPRKTGQEQKTSGRTAMIFVFEDGEMKIQNLRGNLIYATLSPQIAESSGLSQTAVDEIRIAQEQREPVQPGAGTTEDSGGLASGATNIETGTFSLVQTTGHPAAGWIQEYRFSSKQVAAIDNFGPVYDFRRREGWMEVNASNGVLDMGAVDINGVKEVPESGYATSISATAGNTYAIRLADGTFALVQSTAWGDVPMPYTTTFHYRHQKNGTRSFT
ncbi:MAG: hypothetical protein WC352_03210 [Candidatus Omnitrophota bacterium]|jgi:hypothetical protein